MTYQQLMDDDVRMSVPVPKTCNKRRDIQSLEALSLTMSPSYCEVAVILKVSLPLPSFMNIQGLHLSIAPCQFGRVNFVEWSTQGFLDLLFHSLSPLWESCLGVAVVRLFFSHC